MSTILGSHNTMSYLPSKKWWMRPFECFARCQDKTLLEQYKSGVRYFDFRINWFKSGLEFCHGLMIYNSEAYGKYYSPILIIKELLDKAAEDGQEIYVRVILECTKEETNDRIRQFKEFCQMLRNYADTKCRFRFGIKTPWNIYKDEFNKTYVEISKQFDIKWHALIPIKWWKWEQDRIESALRSFGYSGIISKDYV